MTYTFKYSPTILCRVIALEQLRLLGIQATVNDLNELTTEVPLPVEQREKLEQALAPYGIQLHQTASNTLVEKIKQAIRDMVSLEEGVWRGNISEHLSKKLNYSYGHLTSVFSEETHISIAHFVILQKIERIKELLVENKLSLTEISYRLNYSSVSHLSNQFKQITGLNPSRYKELILKRREITRASE